MNIRKRLPVRLDAYMKFVAWGLINVSFLNDSLIKHLIQRGLVKVVGERVVLAGKAIKAYKEFVTERKEPKREIAMHRTRPVRKER